MVTSAASEAVIGASIMEVGATDGTISDIDSNFTLSVSDNVSIQVSFIGFSSQILSAEGKISFRIILEKNSKFLREAVVTGYGGKVSRAKLTNSISTVNPQTLDKDIYTNPSQVLSGSVPGLEISLTSGDPTSSPKIILRGGTEFDDSRSPLVMVDGQLRDNFDGIDPQSIASMDILKDAGVAAIYGTRTSNGVVLITTKSGRAGHQKINFRANIGLGYVNNPYDLLGAEDYVTVLRTAYRNTPRTATANLTGSTAFGTGSRLGTNTVWNIMGKADEDAYLLNMGWREMQDPLGPSKTVVYKETKLEEYSLRNPVMTQDYAVSMSGGNAESNLQVQQDSGQ